MRRARLFRSASWALAILALAGPAGGCASSVDSLLEDLEDEDAEDRVDAAAELGGMGPEAARAAKALEDRMARDASPVARAACTRALSRIGAPGDGQAFVRALEDKDPLVRSEAVLALGRAGRPDAADALAPLLAKDPAAEVRRACALALGLLGAFRHAEGLIQALSDRDMAVRARARESLCRLTCRDLGPSPEEWLQWWEGFQARMGAPPR